MVELKFFGVTESKFVAANVGHAAIARDHAMGIACALPIVRALAAPVQMPSALW
jgi:hypothetical protein